MDDRRRQGVSQHGFETVTDLDTHLSVVGCHDQDNPVIANLVTDPPSPTKLIAVILDGITLQIRDRRHHQLVTRLLLEICQLRGELLLYLRRKKVRFIYHSAGQGWELRCGKRRTGQRNKCQNRYGDGAARSCNASHWVGAVWVTGGAAAGAKLTLGADCADVEAANICMGLEPLWIIAQKELGKVLNSRL